MQECVKIFLLLLYHCNGVKMQSMKNVHDVSKYIIYSRWSIHYNTELLKWIFIWIFLFNCIRKNCDKFLQFNIRWFNLLYDLRSTINLEISWKKYGLRIRIHKSATLACNFSRFAFLSSLTLILRGVLKGSKFPHGENRKSLWEHTVQLGRINVNSFWFVQHKFLCLNTPPITICR